MFEKGLASCLCRYYSNMKEPYVKYIDKTLGSWFAKRVFKTAFCDTTNYIFQQCLRVERCTAYFTFCLETHPYPKWIIMYFMLTHVHGFGCSNICHQIGLQAVQCEMKLFPCLIDLHHNLQLCVTKHECYTHVPISTYRTMHHGCSKAFTA